MKQKFPNLPRWICKQPNGRFRNMKTGEWLSISQLKSKSIVEPVNTELKEEIIQSKRWDLNY